MLPNLRPNQPNAGASYNRVAFSQGVGHLLQRIVNPTIAYYAPGGMPRAANRAAPVRWGVPWARTSEDIARAAQVAELAQFRRTEEHFPDSAGERVWYYDEIQRHTISGAQVQAAAAAGQSIVMEIARAPVREYGMGVLERINTYVRYQQLDADGGPAGPRNVLASYNDDVEPVIGDPFPFPVTHPADGARTFSVRYVLMFQNVPMTIGATPRILTPTAGLLLPVARIYRTWADQRYAWGARASEGHQILFGGHGILRLFAVVSQTQGAIPDLSFSLELAGRLTGYTQSSGARCAAVSNAIIRR